MKAHRPKQCADGDGFVDWDYTWVGQMVRMQRGGTLSVEGMAQAPLGQGRLAGLPLPATAGTDWASREDEMTDAKPIKVLMFCAMGMSSSLLEKKTIEYAAAAGVPLELRAITQAEMAQWDFGARRVDMVVVAPQVRFQRKRVAQAAAPYNIIVQDIDPVVFGMADGEKLFQQIVAAVQARDGGA
jgi:cellobiose PTS system EIIB component